MENHGIWIDARGIDDWDGLQAYLTNLQNENKETIEVSEFVLAPSVPVPMGDFAILSLNNDMSKINEIEKELDERFKGLKITMASRTKINIMDD
jgi:hypothetical protein